MCLRISGVFRSDVGCCCSVCSLKPGYSSVEVGKERQEPLPSCFNIQTSKLCRCFNSAPAWINVCKGCCVTRLNTQCTSCSLFISTGIKTQNDLRGMCNNRRATRSGSEWSGRDAEDSARLKTFDLCLPRPWKLGAPTVSVWIYRW